MGREVTDTISVFSYCWNISLKSSVKYSILRILIKLLSSIMPLLTAIFFRNIINNLIEKDNVGEQEIIASVLAYVLSIIVNLMLINLNIYVMNMHSFKIQNYIKKMIASKVASFDIQYFDDSEVYDAITNAEMNIQSTTNVIWGLMDGIGCVVSSTISFCVLVSYNLWVGVVMLFISIPNAIYSQIYTKKLYKFEKENVIKNRKSQYFYSLLISRQTSLDIRFWNLDRFFLDKYSDSWNAWYQEKKELLKRRNIAQIVTSCLPYICIGFILTIMAIKIRNNNNIGDFTLYASQIEQMSSNVINLIAVVISIYDNKMRVKNIIELDKVQNKIQDGTLELNRQIESIEFRNVSFTYPYGNMKVIDNISFKFNAGDRVAIVGSNGAGKTTILKLIIRLYDPDEGEIYINNQNIKDFTINSLRNKISVFFQQSIDYALTAEENIKLSDLSCIDNKCFDNALNKSGFASVIQQYPLKTKTIITKLFDSDGIQLSAGQTQKMGLARTFYRNRDIYLLDEPSSSLDPKAEYDLFNTLSLENRSKIILFISHRLSNIGVTDRIVVIKNGRLVEEGTHEELMKLTGEYYRLYQYQASKYRKNYEKDKTIYE